MDEIKGCIVLNHGNRPEGVLILFFGYFMIQKPLSEEGCNPTAGKFKEMERSFRCPPAVLFCRLLVRSIGIDRNERDERQIDSDMVRRKEGTCFVYGACGQDACEEYGHEGFRPIRKTASSRAFTSGHHDSHLSAVWALWVIACSGNEGIVKRMIIAARMGRTVRRNETCLN